MMAGRNLNAGMRGQRPAVGWVKCCDCLSQSSGEKQGNGIPKICTLFNGRNAQREAAPQQNGQFQRRAGPFLRKI